MQTEPDPVQLVVGFVEGKVPPAAFAECLYENQALETFLSDPSLEWGSTYIVTNPYYYCLELDYGTTRGVLNAKGALQLFLDRKGIAATPDKATEQRHDLLTKVQPGWLDVDLDWLERTVLPEAGDRTGKNLETWLKGRLRELFRCRKRPPRWIQNPDWPIGENGPLYFLGQIAIDDCELFHDEAAAFVFLDPTTGATATIIQVA